MEGMVSTERGEGLLATGLAELLLSKRRADLKEQRPSNNKTGYENCKS